MYITADNPAKNLRKINSLGFSLLLVLMCAYQGSVMLENYYSRNAVISTDLSNQHHSLTQQIGKNLSLSLTANSAFVRNYYLTRARQEMNFLRSIIYAALLRKDHQSSQWLVREVSATQLHEQAGNYLKRMNDAVLQAVAAGEQQDFTPQAQFLLTQSLHFYLENEGDFIALISQGAMVYDQQARNYLTQIPVISWALMGLMVLIALLNRHLIHERAATSVDLQYQELHKKLEFQHALLNSAHEAIVSIAPDGTILVFSPSATLIFGYTADEVIGKNISVLMPKDFQFRQDVDLKDNFTGSISTAINTSRCVEVQGRRRNNDLFPLFLKLTELKTPRQHVFIAFLRDLTEERAANLALLQAKNEAEAANKAKSQFLSNMTHELKTPLNAIMGFSQLLESDNAYPLTQAQTEWVNHIYKAGKLLMALISDVLDLSKIETGNVKLAMEEFSVNEIMLEALSLIEAIATQNNIKIRTRIDPLATLYINADSLRFKQILINLLSNAIKYNSENGTIILSSKVTNGRVKISIKDSGKGIDEGKLIELFKPFNRLGAEKLGVEGTGIGLCIAKNLVERMGGEIGVRNNKQVGCCFWVEFPLVRQEQLFTENTDDIAKKLQTELTYLQESLNHIGLIKTPVSEAVSA